ncbi:MAG: IPTL-CTERM sorting domain-containing protein [Caulobacterales bacterium]|nr:IPTL-CTERM sorting domain-containing protein [Caulobacterales bacterium]
MVRILGLGAVVALSASAASAQVISDFRLRGPSGANDEFIRIYNNTGAPLTVTASSGTGWAIVASDGVVRCTIPNATVIPTNGSFLCANSTSYSLSGNPSGVADATYATNIADNAGIALFNNNTGGANFILANRLDAVGSTSEADTLYKEGAGYPALTPFSIDYGFTRDRCGKSGSITNNAACTSPGLPLDTNNNAADLVFVDTNGTSAGAGQRLGAPGPANLAASVTGSIITNAAFDSCVANAAPNVIRDFTSDPGNNSTFGTLDIRRTFTNTSGGPITNLRFRVIDLTTFPAPSGYADLRPRSSTDLVVTVDRPPCGAGTSNVTVFGTTLDQPPSQPNGGGFNSTLTAPSVTVGTPLAAGASIDLRFLLGIQQTSTARFAIVAEGTPSGGGIYEFLGCTDSGACGPAVSSIARAGASPTSAATLTFTVTFNQAVTGVDSFDFSLVTTGGIAGASVTSVSGSGTTYTVVVNRGTGTGTIGLNLVDNDSIQNLSSAALGGPGVGNGNFTGQVYTISAAAGIPTMTEWAMILFGIMLAGFAAFTIQRRRQFV